MPGCSQQRLIQHSSLTTLLELPVSAPVKGQLETVVDVWMKQPTTWWNWTFKESTVPAERLIQYKLQRKRKDVQFGVITGNIKIKSMPSFGLDSVNRHCETENNYSVLKTMWNAWQRHGKKLKRTLLNIMKAGRSGQCLQVLWNSWSQCHSCATAPLTAKRVGWCHLFEKEHGLRTPQGVLNISGYNFLGLNRDISYWPGRDGNSYSAQLSRAVGRASLFTVPFTTWRWCLYMQVLDGTLANMAMVLREEMPFLVAACRYPAKGLHHAERQKCTFQGLELLLASTLLSIRVVNDPKTLKQNTEIMIFIWQKETHEADIKVSKISL